MEHHKKVRIVPLHFAFLAKKVKGQLLQLAVFRVLEIPGPGTYFIWPPDIGPEINGRQFR